MRLAGRAFTLIELLIVVAIIAILAAIAVPNFLEAQTRSKVSRCAADMRSIRTAIESYVVDTNKYPETDLGPWKGGSIGIGLIRCTTPIAYITSIPKSPFKESGILPQGIGYAPGKPHYANEMNCYLYVRAQSIPGDGDTPDSNANQIDDNYELDRIYYVSQNASLVANNAVRTSGFWELKSVGPNNVDDFNVYGTFCRPYDPTNGTVSAGDVVTFGDISGFAKGSR
jgi:prepilin-type N-terminal cleavage/methylation domain-containing protein